jgi:hypothetical protein
MRNIEIITLHNTPKRIINNKIIIDIAILFINQWDVNKKEVLRSINHIRVFKKLYLPFKLIRMNGKKITICHIEVNIKVISIRTNHRS